MHYEKSDPRLLSAGHFAGLKFDDGWWFIQIIGTEYNEVKPWTLKDSNGNKAPLDPNTSGIDNDNIVDGNDNKILEPNDENRNTIHQILFGVAPSRAQVFPLFGRERNTSVEDYDSPGDPATYISGFDSPYDNPSSTSEVMYINSMAPLRLQAYNPTDTELEVKVSFHVNKLRYTTVTDKGLMKAMLQGQQPADLNMAGLGVQNSDQVGIPNWLNEAFGNHIYSTEEILDSNSGDSTTAFEGAAELERSGN